MVLVDGVVVRDQSIAIDAADWRLPVSSNAAQPLKVRDLLLAILGCAIFAHTTHQRIVVQQERNLDGDWVTSLPNCKANLFGAGDYLPACVALCHNRGSV